MRLKDYNEDWRGKHQFMQNKYDEIVLLDPAASKEVLQVLFPDQYGEFEWKGEMLFDFIGRYLGRV